MTELPIIGSDGRPGGSSAAGFGGPAAPGRPRPRPPRRKVRLRELGILLSVAIGIAVFGALNPRFLTRDSAVAVLLGASTDGLMVVGMTIVIVCGAFDLSIGSTMAAGGLVAAKLMLGGLPVWLAVTAGLATGALVGLANGLCVTRLRINPFITTLGTMSIVRGIVLVATKTGYPTGFPESFKDIAWGSVLGIPVPVIVLAAATVAADLALRHVRYLRQVFFIGSNETAAVLTGIRVGAVKTFAFVLTGVLAAAAGIIVTARGNAADPNEGIGAELRVISAVIVGGASLSGGRGTILGSFLGLLLMQVITTGLIFVDVPPEAQQVAVGFVLILAAVIDRAGTTLGRAIRTILGTRFARRLVASLTRSRSKKMERALNVILAVALVVVLAIRFGGDGPPSKVGGGANGSGAGPVPVAGGAPGSGSGGGSGPASRSASGSASDHAPDDVSGQASGQAPDDVWGKASGQASRLESIRISQQKYVAIAAAVGAPYWIDSRAGLLDKARELGVSATFTGPPTVDVNAQIDYVDKMIAQKVDGIIMIPMSDAVTPAIDKAIESGIPVVCADADAPSSKRYSFVGTGNFNAGVQGGTELARLLGGKGRVALITIPGAAHLAQRVQGYLEALKAHPGIQVVATLNDQGSATESQKACRALLQAQEDLDGFGCVDAAGGQGAAVAVKEAGRVGKVRIVAMDRDAATLKFIEEGVIDVSVAQRTYTMTYLALQMLYDLRNDRVKLVDDWRKVGIHPLPPNVDTGSFLITRENVTSFYRE